MYLLLVLSLNPTLREADPGGLGACPQKTTRYCFRHGSFFFQKALIGVMKVCGKLPAGRNALPLYIALCGVGEWRWEGGV
jgi:hypothetical protein